MEIINNTVYFESDTEFEDFCIAPYISVKTGDTSYHGEYSDLYKQYLKEGKSFVIMDRNSVVYRRMCASKRVPVMLDGSPMGIDRCVQLRVKNLEPWFDNMLLHRDLEPKDRDAITKLINENPQITYQQIAETLDMSEKEALCLFKWYKKEGIIKE